MSFKTPFWVLGAVTFGFSQTAWADGSFQGRLRERGTKTPLAGANVFILPHKLKAVTEADGSFRFPSIPDGDYTIVVNLPGYLKLELYRKTESTPPQEDLFVQKSSYELYETTVFGKGEKRDDSTRTLKRQEFLKAPGAGGDPLKAVQNLPGVNRPAPFSAQVIIQGSAPDDTRYQIEGHEVPLIFHFGGLSSVVLPEALDRVDMLTAGYGPENSRALGGLVSVATREPRKDRIHGLGFIDTFNAGGFVEGPVGKEGSLLFGVRRSYVGEVLRAVLPEDGTFDLTAAPAYQDAVLVYESPVTDRDRVKVTAVVSDDQLEFLFPNPAGDPAIRGTLSNRTTFYRIIPQLTHRHSERTVSRWSLGMGQDSIKVNLGSNFFRLGTRQLTARGEVERKMSESWTSQWGYDNRYTWADVDLLLPQVVADGGVINPIAGGELRQATVSQNFNLIGLYWRNQIKPEGSAWTLLPSLRGDSYSATNEILILPRLGVRYAWSEALTLRSAGGWYAQPPLEQQTDTTTGNPDLKAPRATHLAFAVDQDFRGGESRGFTLTTGVFWKKLSQLVVESSAFVTRNGSLTRENFNNNSSGNVRGAEVLLKGDFLPWKGWVSYTLSKSTRDVPGQGEVPFDFDQTHLLTAVASRELGRNWTASTRLRFVTGNPLTPITGGIFDSDNDVYIPVRGPFFSTRLSPFFQWDLRLDKKWIYDTWILSLYLDIQNATNRMNTENLVYSADYSQSAKASGLPLVPIFGLQGEF